MSAGLEREARELVAFELFNGSIQVMANGRLRCTGTGGEWFYKDTLRRHEIEEFVRMYLTSATLREKEIEELRALLREACGILNDAIKTDETFWLEEMRGTNEDLTERIMLMLPPTPVPETKE